MTITVDLGIEMHPATSILGIDPGLAHMGLALLRIGPSGELLLDDLTVIETKRDREAIKTSSVAEDNMRRLRELDAEFHAWTRGRWVSLIAAERFSSPRHSPSAVQMALSWGVLVAFARPLGLDIKQPSPQRIKEGVARKGASKKEVQAALMERFGPRATTGKLREQHILDGLHEHAFDALGAAVVSVPGASGPLFSRAS